MPYTISRNNKEEYCVFKADEEGEPTGETLGCHAMQADASAQIGAIEAEEKSKMVVRLTQLEVNYVAVSTQKGKACANCRWFAKEGYENNEEFEGGYCHQVANWPDDIVSNGYCDRWEAKPDMQEVAPLEVVIVEDNRAAVEIESAPEDGADYISLSPSSNQKGFIQSLKARLPGLKPGQTVFQDADGRRYMFIVTSNSYEDRTHQAIASKALERYVDSCWIAEDYFKSNNVHQVWHHDALTVGDIVWADMSGPFLLEISKERGDVVSKKAWDYWESDEGSKDLGASHRFLYPKEDKGADTLHIVSKFETTTLPRQAAAANLLTFSGVIPMSKSRDEYLDKMFGVEGVAEMLKEGPQKLAEKLAEAGVQHKSVDEPTPEEAAQKAQENFGALLMQMIESQADILARFDERETAAAQKDMNRDTQFTTLETQLKALADDNTALRQAMKQSPRASESPATIIHDEKTKADIEAKSVVYDPAFPGMNVPLEK